MDRGRRGGRLGQPGIRGDHLRDSGFGQHRLGRLQRLGRDLPRQRSGVREITLGFWQDIYKGDLGRARVGVQYEFVTLDLFAGSPLGVGANSGLHPNNNIVFFSLRYYPFN
jgi:hypothetical protein